MFKVETSHLWQDLKYSAAMSTITQTYTYKKLY